MDDRNGSPVAIRLESAADLPCPGSYIERAASLGMDLAAMVAAGSLEIMYPRPLDLSVDEALQVIRERVVGLGAQRVIIDSLSGFEAALPPAVGANDHRAARGRSRIRNWPGDARHRPAVDGTIRARGRS